MTKKADKAKRVADQAKKASSKKATAAEAKHRPFAKLKKELTTPARAPKTGAAPVTKATPAPKPSKAPLASTEERSDFVSQMIGVRPLGVGGRDRVPKSRETIVSARKATPPPSESPRDQQAREELSRLVVTGELRFEVEDDGTLLAGRRLDADPRELRRLRKGHYGSDGKLDLHGKSAGEARLLVEKFLQQRRRQGDLAVLIIHGKGKHSAGGTAILRGELGAWLSQGSAASDVLAFASLEDADGESGAVLVRLARWMG